MRTKTMIITLLVIATAALITAACGRAGSPEGEQGAKPQSADRVINSTKEGDLTITLASAAGELKEGENELTLSFTDASGKPVDVKATSLKFHMPAMGTMAEMNDVATLTATDTPGKYHARVKIEMAGSWEARINYEGPSGTGQASMPVIAK